MTNIDQPPKDVAQWLQVAVDQRQRNLEKLKVMWGTDSAAVAHGAAEIERIKSAVTSAVLQAANAPLKQPK